MCGRFINLNRIDKLNKIFEINESKNIENEISYNIAPSQSTIIITNSKFFKIEKANWGIKFFDKRQIQEKSIINSRLETIQKKILFKESFEKRRCVIPANGYYEWSIKDNIKNPYFINIPEKEMIYFAGIWKYFNFKKSSMKLFSIITKPANSLLKEIHDRMPVTLSAEESKDYLDHNNSNYLTNNAQLILEEYFEFFKISKFVNNPINNSSECIKPIN
jgi:putative SOS response-associated peptidase YedK